MRKLIILGLALILFSLPLTGMASNKKCSGSSRYYDSHHTKYYQKYHQSYYTPDYRYCGRSDKHYCKYQGNRKPYYRTKYYCPYYKGQRHYCRHYNYRPRQACSRHYYSEANPVTKFVAGVGEVVFSWTEIPASIIKHSHKRCDNITGTGIGLAEGIVLGVGDVIEGTIDATLAILPPYRPVELPPYGKRKGNFLDTLKELDDKFQENYW